MAEFPAMPLFTDAYLGDTRHLTTIQHGAYLLLLIIAWRSQNGSLPNDDRLLARYTGLTPAQWLRMKPDLLPFFEVENDCLIQRRLRDELDLVRQRRDSAAANGRASALKRKGRHSTKRKRSVNGASTPKPNPFPEESSNDDSTPIVPFAAPQPEWAHFVDYRKGRGNPLTPHAVKLALAKLERLQSEGSDPREVLNQSILNGWAGLFPIKEDRRSDRSRHNPDYSATESAARSLLADNGFGAGGSETGSGERIAGAEGRDQGSAGRAGRPALPSPSRSTH